MASDLRNMHDILSKNMYKIRQRVSQHSTSICLTGALPALTSQHYRSGGKLLGGKVSIWHWHSNKKGLLFGVLNSCISS